MNLCNTIISHHGASAKPEPEGAAALETAPSTMAQPEPEGLAGQSRSGCFVIMITALAMLAARGNLMKTEW